MDVLARSLLRWGSKGVRVYSMIILYMSIHIGFLREVASSMLLLGPACFFHHQQSPLSNHFIANECACLAYLSLLTKNVLINVVDSLSYSRVAIEI